MYLVRWSSLNENNLDTNHELVAHDFSIMLSDLLFGIHNRESNEGSYAVVLILAVTTATVMVVGIFRI
ncbi:hypothetical protein RhiirA5_437717 [Rhizophagus irregularis]|uniref:Uncharacterized protein n=1 Tax=Rhizophagus irregularis TaxID=588596 RepID=A0A2N0NK42_9GLOM|nr:hypothetical protein RhiirA5_437717 [Rhizophagus irregularis]